jgi:5-oxoprolinase (ATP-hydrolysing) subunit A
MKRIDLNADLGEGGPDDESLLALVSSANIACGGHAGDEQMMRRTLALAQAAGVAIGAHPGYEDRENFGRKALDLPHEEVRDLVVRQVRALACLAEEIGVSLHHVKPHGALYHQASREPDLAAAVVRGILDVSPGLILYALPQSELAEAGRAAGLCVHHEGFVDRGYREDGSLIPRGEPGAVIEAVDVAVAQALALVAGKTVQTLCVHGDGGSAVPVLRALRKQLESAGVGGSYFRDRCQ